MRKKIVLTLIIIINIFAFCAFNVSAENVENGKCGENLTWTLDKEGTLNIRGNGKMEDYKHGMSPWSWNEKIKTIIIDEGVTSIGNFAFLYCTALTDITIPENVTTIGLSAFKGCVSLANVSIPDNVTTISNALFDGCIGLTNISIGENVTNIEGFAFNNCKGLTEIYWNAKNVSDITENKWVFGCAGQNSEGINVTFGENVETIPAYLFYPCDYDTSYTPKIVGVTIGNNVTTIGDSAFRGCTDLTSVYYEGSKRTWKNIVIKGNNRELEAADKEYKIKTVHIMFDLNGGENAPIVQESDENSTITLTNEIPTRKYYEFLGWAKSSNATEAEYKPGDNIYMGTDDIVLYAVWKGNVATNSSVVNNIVMVTPINVQVGNCIIFSCYKDSRMVYIDTYSYNDETIIPFVPNVEYDTIKIMVWESISNLKPLSDVEEL